MFRILLLFISLILTLPFTANASTPVVQKFEGEAFFGFSIPVGGYHGGTSQISGAMGLEGRYNFKGTPWDCGVQLGLYSARRGYKSTYDLWQNNRTLALFTIVGDYNFRQGKKVNPFVGSSIGFASNDVVGDDLFPSSGTSFLFAPRVGVELVHHIRLTGQLNICRVGYNNFSLSIGVVLGGRPKKQ